MVCGVCVGLILMATVSCRRLSPDWNGTWKLDPTKSDIPGPTITVSITPDGMYHNWGGDGGTANFRCDGNRYQATDLLTVFCTQKNSSDLEITGFKNESKVFINHWELSPDGKVLTVASTSFHADGSVKSDEVRYMRTFGSTGFGGEWRNVNPLAALPSIRQISLQGHELHQSIPDKGRSMDVTLDGTDAAIRGPFVSPGASIALKERNPRELDSTMKQHGRVVSVGYWRISADGRSLTELWWVPSRPNVKAVVVYEKQ